jgi:hypothetical protein
MKKIIRLTSFEKKNIKSKSKYLTLFYYKNTTVKKGENYEVPTILKYGKRFLSKDGNKNKIEVLPKLSFKNSFRVKCIEVKNHIAYEDLSNNIFKYSLKNIQNIEQLQKSILRRYKISRPFLTKKEIVKGGIAYTIVEIVD